MIKDRPRLRCNYCYGRHAGDECPSKMKDSGFPLETPSHNGPYVGPIKVRVIPPAVRGVEIETDALRKAKTGHTRQSALARRRKLSTMCRWCGKNKCKLEVSGYYCSWSCRALKGREYARKQTEREKAAVSNVGKKSMRRPVLPTGP